MLVSFPALSVDKPRLLRWSCSVTALVMVKVSHYCLPTSFSSVLSVITLLPSLPCFSYFTPFYPRGCQHQPWSRALFNTHLLFASNHFSLDFVRPLLLLLTLLTVNHCTVYSTVLPWQRPCMSSYCSLQPVSSSNMWNIKYKLSPSYWCSGSLYCYDGRKQNGSQKENWLSDYAHSKRKGALFQQGQDGH